MAGLADGVAKGSGRSVPGLDIGSAVIAARQRGILSTGGGHAMAAGFMLPQARLADFHAWLDERLAGAAALPTATDLMVEASAQVPGCTVALAQQIARLAPFGMANEEPVLVLPRARIVRSDRVGKDSNTIRAFVEAEGGGVRLKAMMFRAGESAMGQALLSREAPLHLAGYLRAEEWNGNTTPGFILTDAALIS